MNLYVDMGNSRIKLLADCGDMATAALYSNNYTDPDWLQGITTKPARVIALYVTDQNRADELQQQCRQGWGLPVIWLQTSASAAGLTNAYPVPENLGVDRWAAMAGAYSLQQQDLVIADFGTATTIDAVNANGQHMGGWIAPGIDAMRSMQQQRLPHLFRPGALPGKPVPLAANTSDALESGVLQTQCGSLQRFLAIATDAGLHDPVCILTGGYAQLIAGLLESETVIEPRLVFYGMRQLMLEHIRQNQPEVR